MVTRTCDEGACQKRIVFKTPAGGLQVVLQEGRVVSASFVSDDADHEPLPQFLEVQPVGTPFEQLVWKTTMAITSGTTVSYEELARMIGKPKAARAVARALARNRIAVVIPCHRVIRKNGHLGGYAWGMQRKKKLLDHERS